uniref:Zinc-binding protein A33-like n=1 Tax=Gadus morhua TaxID=8049 RepID=A0A8C5AU34_GADMO
MATSSSHLKEDCLCPVCHDLYRDPILLMCGHSFCRNCIQEWRTQKGIKTCPVCQEMCSFDLPPRNLALKNLTDCLREEASRQTAEDLCETHGEKLKLFCVDHQKPICVICRDAKDHKKHQCVPINEAAEDNKKELRIALMHLRTKLSKFEEEKLTCNKMCTHIQKQAKQTENNIKGEFQKLYQFMRAEEAARIDALRKEAAKKSQAMQIRLINLIAETSSLSKTMKAAETDLEAADLSFMINYDAIKKRAQCTLPDPETPSGALIDEAKHRGNLLFHVWKKMKSIIQYTPFCLDPNTAKSHVIVSDDLMSLTKNYPGKEVPSNPERCTLHDQVLGSTGISSGRHSWDVQLGGIWSVGVITKTRRLEEVTEAGLVLHSGIVVQRSPEKMDFPIEVDKIPEKVRLSFDQDNGKLLFYDLDTKKVIRTITYKFKGVYFPFFSGDVKLIPQCPPLV